MYTYFFQPKLVNFKAQIIQMDAQQDQHGHEGKTRVYKMRKNN